MKKIPDFFKNMKYKQRWFEKFRIDCVSPLDAKYREDCNELRPYISYGADIMGCVDIQYTLLETSVEFGRGTKKDLRQMKKARKKINPVNIHYIEKDVTHHDQLAVIEEIGRYIPIEVKALLHPGTTSYDIIDTSRARLFTKAWKNVIRPKQVEVTHKLCGLAEKYMKIPQVGRTHLQDTSPVRFGGQLSNYAARLAERVEFLDDRVSKLKGKVGGIVNTGAGLEVNFPGRGREFRERVLGKLDLEPDKTATQVTEKITLSDVGHGIVTSQEILYDIANDTRQLCSSAIGEVSSKGFEQEGGLSSTDAKKKNPITWENIAGTAWVVQSGMGILYSIIPSDFQRDLRNSKPARYQPQQMMAEFYISLKKTSKALDKVVINVERMNENLKPIRDSPSEAMVSILKSKVSPPFIHPEYGLVHDFVKKKFRECELENIGDMKEYKKEIEKAQKEGGEIPKKPDEIKPLDFCMKDDYFNEFYDTLEDWKKDILNGQIEKYLGFSEDDARDNIAYARKVI